MGATTVSGPYDPAMRTRALAVSTVVLTVAVLLGGCGSDPDIAVDGAPAPVDAAPGVDLSEATFVDLTGEAAPEVDALDNVFKAKYVEVAPGATITFRNDGRNTHNLLPVSEGAFPPLEAEAFEPGTEAEITFDEPGDYAYYCSLHGTTTKGMVGAVRVAP